jgi:hypothetical protein
MNENFRPARCPCGLKWEDCPWNDGCCHRIVDPGHTHPTPGDPAVDSGFDIDEHLAALPAGVRGDYAMAVKRCRS